MLRIACLMLAAGLVAETACPPGDPWDQRVALRPEAMGPGDSRWHRSAARWGDRSDQPCSMAACRNRESD